MEKILTFLLIQANKRKEVAQVGILRNYAGWYIHTDWSNKIAIGIIIIATMALITKYGFMKMSWLWLKVGSPWKLFGKIVSWAAIVGAVYGICFLVSYYTPPKSERLFKKIIANQIDVQTKGETANLEKMAANSGISTLSPDELNLAQKNRVDAAEKRENLKTMLEKPETKTAKTTSVKPKEEVWDWTFEWEAAAEQMASGKQKIPGLINDTRFVSCNDKVLKFNYKRPSGKIVNMTLNRNNPETEYYFGRVSQSDLYLRVWLIPNQEEPGNFKGRADNGPNTISVDIFLKKKL